MKRLQCRPNLSQNVFSCVYAKAWGRADQGKQVLFEVFVYEEALILIVVNVKSKSTTNSETLLDFLRMFEN